jgi:ribosomal protein S18 acetylase RimI-like enzyme
MIQIRPARLGDAAAIAAVHVESWRTAYPGMVPQRVLDGLSVERRTVFWTALLADPGEARTWVAERDGGIVAFAGTTIIKEPDGPRPVLETIYVLAEARGEGIGRRLMETATADLTERGFRSVTLWVLAANDRARRFYERHGWRSDGEKNLLDVDGTPVEEIRYELALAD